MELKQKLLQIAEENGLEPTENFERIVRVKEKFGIGVRCPCDKENPDRYCCSPLCLSDIETKGTCHCKCWKKKGETND